MWGAGAWFILLLLLPSLLMFSGWNALVKASRPPAPPEVYDRSDLTSVGWLLLAYNYHVTQPWPGVWTYLVSTLSQGAAHKLDPQFDPYTVFPVNFSVYEQHTRTAKKLFPGLNLTQAQSALCAQDHARKPPQAAAGDAGQPV